MKGEKKRKLDNQATAAGQGSKAKASSQTQSEAMVDAEIKACFRHAQHCPRTPRTHSTPIEHNVRTLGHTSLVHPSGRRPMRQGRKSRHEKRQLFNAERIEIESKLLTSFCSTTARSR